MLPALVLLLLPAAEPSPEPPTVLKPPVLKYNAKLSEGTGYLVFDVTNPNREPIFYRGYGEDNKPQKSGTISPFYQLKHLQAGEWKVGGVGWCGTGAGTRAVAGRSTVTLRVSPQGPNQMMVGFHWFGTSDRKTGETTWSDPVTPPAEVLRKLLP